VRLSVSTAIGVGLLLAGGAIHARQTTLPASAQQTSLAFEVASVKRTAADARSSSRRLLGRITMNGFAVRSMLAVILGVPSYLIVDGPGWVDEERFDIDAVAPGVPAGDVHRVGLRVMEERFQLRLRQERRNMPVYALVRARRDGRLGPNLRPANGCAPDTSKNSVQPGVRIMNCRAWGPELIQSVVDRPIDDQTGLSGTFDVRLEWSPELGTAASGNDDRVSVFTAVVEQLGLRLESTRGQVEVLAIDHVERPTSN